MPIQNRPFIYSHQQLSVIRVGVTGPPQKKHNPVTHTHTRTDSTKSPIQGLN